MFRIQWDQEEIVALIDLYFKTKKCNRFERSTLIDEFSTHLIRRADILNLSHDTFIRNRNGIVMMLMHLRSIETNVNAGSRGNSKLLLDTWRMYHKQNDEFRRVLHTFKQKYCEQQKEISPPSLHPNNQNKEQTNAEALSSTHNKMSPEKKLLNIPIDQSTCYATLVSEIGYGLANYFEENKIPPRTKFADFLDCPLSEWDSVQLEALPLSVRSINCIKRCSASTTQALLNLSLYEIAATKGMGVKSFAEIIDTFQKLANEKRKKLDCRNAASHMMSPLIQELKKYQTEIIDGKWNDLSSNSLSSESIIYLGKLKLAHNLLGAEMLKYFSANSSLLVEMLTRIEKQLMSTKAQKEDLVAAVSHIPSDRLNNKVLPFITAFYPSNLEKQSLLLSYFGNKESLLKDILSQINYSKNLPMNIISPFLEWCSFSLENEIKKMITIFKNNERSLDILRMRNQGYSLKDIGDKFGLTRERIRQIEYKSSTKFERFQESHHTLLKISALRNGDSVLSPEEIKPYLGEFAEAILHLLKITQCGDYSYNKIHDVFTIGLSDIEKKIEEYVDRLPNQFAKKELDTYLSKAEEEMALPRELVSLQIDSMYNQSDVLFFRGRLSITEMCARILKKYYLSGIHVYDDKKIAEFRERVLEEFGSDTRIADNTRAVAARITSVGVLCGRGIYKAKEYAHISELLLSDIKQFILNYEYPILLMNVLYSHFSQRLQAEGINNKYYLQGLLKLYFSDDFFFRRDYVSRDAESTSFYTSVVDYIRRFDYPVSKSQIYSAFPGISEIIINITTMDESIINYFGEYLHIDHLRIQDYEIQELKGYIIELIGNGETCNSPSLYNYIFTRMPHSLKRWYVRSHYQLFSVCEHLFRDSFQFARPYLSLNSIKISSFDQQAFDYLSRATETKVSDLFDHLQKKQIRIMDSLKFINTLNTEYFLIDQQTLMRIDDIGASETLCEVIEDLIVDEISECIPIKNLICFFNFPKLSVRWTDWLVYSILNKWATKVDVFPSYNQFRYAIPLVAPKGSNITSNIAGKPIIGEQNNFVFDDFDEDIEDIVVEYLEEDNNEFI